MTAERALGKSGLKAPPMMLGGNVFGWTADRDATFAVLDAYVAGGGRLIDTADMYSSWIPGLKGGESETLIGEWIAARKSRDRLMIATKVGRAAGELGGLSRHAIINGIEGSLRRLQTDYVDVYFAHLDDADTPLQETVEVFGELVKAGKVRALGASHYTAARLNEARAITDAAGIARYDLLQPLYNLMSRPAFEGELQDYCVANDIAVTPFWALASGFLTGKYRSEADLAGHARAEEVRPYLTPLGMRVLSALDQVAADTGTNCAQVALAWINSRPSILAPVASATNVKQVEDLLAAMHLQLNPTQIALLDAASDQ
ncbi:aldo/keto reductase [Aquisediminimonas sediminicola]|uniref:aldo/keto reductase n=1 Tax=Alteraquisediminimonas sediminicola TaxID=2676787 RepID=UPI001C8E99E4|nr:aldo/keto reductase [Aquisediminimonas sediminicola]